MRIGELAARSGFSRDTIRYYERVGLLGAPARSDGGYRVYGEQTIRRLNVIRNARGFGFSLSEIRQFMKVRDSGGAPCAQVHRAAERRLAEVDAQMRELARLRRAMRETLKHWNERLRSAGPGRRVGLLEGELRLPPPSRTRFRT
jgi:DNA-binding transcriptional MerR regulator